MAHEFTEWPREPEPQTSAARSGRRPPGKHIGIDLLDPPAPIQARAGLNWPLWLDVVLAVVVLSLGLATVLLLRVLHVF